MAERFDRETLRQFDGSDGSSVYIAYKGKVYDVTESPLFADGEHFEHFAGVDLTDAIEDAPHGDELLEEFPVVGDYEE